MGNSYQRNSEVPTHLSKKPLAFNKIIAPSMTMFMKKKNLSLKAGFVVIVRLDPESLISHLII